MKDYRAEESRIYGILGVVGIIVLGLLLALSQPMHLAEIFLAAFTFYNLGQMARRGLGAVHLSIDGPDLLVKPRKGKLLRLPIRGVMSATFGASLFDLRVLKLEHDSGETIRTLVREKEITSFMARIPDHALTIYWREMIAEGRTHF